MNYNEQTGNNETAILNKVLTELPERCQYVDAPQLSFEELDAIELMSLNGISEMSKLEQLADSAASATEVLINTSKKTEHVLKADLAQITATSRDMANLLKNGSFDINAQVAGSIVIAADIFEKVSKVKSPSDAKISYEQYRHILNAMATQFKGNSRTAATLNNVFVVFGSITETIAETNKKIEHYQMIYKACSDIRQDILDAENASKVVVGSDTIEDSPLKVVTDDLKSEEVEVKATKATKRVKS